MGGNKQPQPIGESLEPLFLLSDEPIGGDHDNHFKPDPFASTIARAALGSRGPFTIGVYGDWGSGKTSALHAAKDMIDKSKEWSHVVTVEFNAWRYEREEHPIVPLVATIERAIEEKLADPESIDVKVRDVVVRGLTKAQQAARALVSIVSVKFKPKLKVPFIAEAEGEVSISPKDGLDRAEKDAERLAREAAAQAKAEQTAYTAARDAALYLSTFETLGKFFTSDKELAEADVRKFPRVVVFIDDLDRCQAEKAFELLENVKLVLCQPGFVFVLALNEVVVRKYIDHLAEKRYGVNYVAIHKSYLDKIVQLPLHMPSRGERFKTFADAMIETRLDKAVDAGRKVELKKLAQVLALSANRTPRSLVRRINTVLIDIALRDESALRGKLVGEKAPYPNFAGLCIVQRTLETALTRERARALAEDTELCKVLHDRGIFGALRWLDEQRDKRGKAADANAKAPSTKDGTSDDDIASVVAPLQDKQRKAILDAIYDEVFLYKEDNDHAGKTIAGTSLLTCPEGKRWLLWHEERRAIMELSTQRPEAAPTVSVGATEGAATSNAPATTPSDLTLFWAAAAQVPSEERQYIERAIRQQLGLSADVELSVTALSRMDDLSFSGDVLSDKGLKWLMSANSPLIALARLYLDGTKASDDSVSILANRPPSHTKWKVLSFSYTRVTDITAKRLAATSGAFSEVRKVYLDRTDVSLAAVAALRKARPELRVHY
jgi:hypothetical protein